MLSDPESQFSKPNWSDSKALNPIPPAVSVLLGGGGKKEMEIKILVQGTG